MAEFMPGYGMPYTYIVDNILSGDRVFNSETTLQNKRDLGLFDYNWLGGANMGYRAWYGNNNIVAWGRKVWSDATLPSFVLPSGSDARGAGIDVSRAFTIAGYTYPALPGMAPGYFSGARPDQGALQGSQSGKPAPPRNLRSSQ
jgi:hypothetical protein